MNDEPVSAAQAPAEKRATPNPAELLLGVSLANGWQVVERARSAKEGTGGCFSVGYVVEGPGGRRAFLKAFDFFSWIADIADPLRELQPLISAYNYERDLLKVCGNRRMSRVVRAIEDGTVTVPGVPELGSLATVAYLIFELGDGDVRLQLDVSNRFDLAWALRALHHVAIGLEQLHRAEVAHQDLKPSNVLMFDDRKTSKIGDLGRAAARGTEAPLVANAVAGDRRYSPPENLYDVYSTEWNARLARDAYLLGSMVVFFFTHTSMTALLAAHLDPALRWGKWTGSFDDVLPFVNAAFETALDSISRQLPEGFQDDILEIVRELCQPDPGQRGHPLNRRFHLNPYSLERYVSRLNVLAARAEYAAGIAKK
jgi:serine/threonine protein kinase